MNNKPLANDIVALCADVGGTKTSISLVRAGKILTQRKVATGPLGGEGAIVAIEESIKDWRNDFDCIGVAVSGHVEAGFWTSVNHNTLDLAEGFDLAKRLSVFGYTFEICNDAQAAAYGEFLFGDCADTDLVYLTISTGVGGGIICNGKLMRGHHGLAGHFGLMCADLKIDESVPPPLEGLASGNWMRAAARLRNHNISGKELFDLANGDNGWADEIIEQSALRIANLCRNISYILDPSEIIIGGGVGLATGYLERVKRHYATLEVLRPTSISQSALREDAGAIGVAALATETHLKRGEYR